MSEFEILPTPAIPQQDQHATTFSEHVNLPTTTTTTSSLPTSDNTKVFYRNLSTDASEEMVKNLFIPYGTIQDFVLLKNNQDIQKKSKGAGFVKFSTHEEAAAAITGLNGTVPSIGVGNIGSSTMEVRWPESNEEKHSRKRVPSSISSFAMHSSSSRGPSSSYNSRYPGPNAGYPSQHGHARPPMNAYNPNPYAGYNPYAATPTNPTGAIPNTPYGYTLPTNPNPLAATSPYGQLPLGYTMNPYGLYVPNASPYTIPPNPSPYTPGLPSSTGTSNINETTIFVHGLPEGYTEVELSALFANSGTVTSSKIVLDKATAKPRDYGFVTFATHDGALQAVKLMNNMVMPHGRKLRVEIKSGGMEKSGNRHGGMSRSGGGPPGHGGYDNRGGSGYGRR